MSNNSKPATYKPGDVVITGYPRRLRMVGQCPVPIPDIRHYSPCIYAHEIEEVYHNALPLANERQIAIWNQRTLHPHRLHYSISEHKMKRWFLPFDRVLVRNFDDQPWRCDIFSHYTTSGPFAEPYKCLRGGWGQCIPYNPDHDSITGYLTNSKTTPDDFTQL